MATLNNQRVNWIIQILLKAQTSNHSSPKDGCALSEVGKPNTYKNTLNVDSQWEKRLISNVWHKPSNIGALWHIWFATLTHFWPVSDPYGGFLKWWVPPNHLLYVQIIPYKPSSYWVQTFSGNHNLCHPSLFPSPHLLVLIMHRARLSCVAFFEKRRSHHGVLSPCLTVSTLWLCQNSYWTWWFIVDLPIENGDFP